jgi:hypothetical protein
MAAKVQGTWRAIGEIGVVSDFTTVDTTRQFHLGKIVKVRDVGTTDYGDAELMYCLGGTNIAAGSVVQILGDYTLVLLAARLMGKVGLAISALTSATATWGWVQISGRGVAKCDTVAAAAPCYIDGTAGRIDDAAVAGDAVIGMQTYSSDDTNTCVVNFPTGAYTSDADNA